MQIFSGPPQKPSPLPGRALPSQPTPTPLPDGFRPAPKEDVGLLKSAWQVTRLAVPVAAGIYGGLAQGGFAAVAGALAATPGAAAIGALGSALIAEKILGTSESTTVGAALTGGVIGGLAGLAGGAYLGYHAASVGATVGLGLLGAVTSGIVFLNQRQR